MNVVLFRSFIGGALLLAGWAFVAPSCMTFRKSDALMKKSFERDSVHLFTRTVLVDGRHIHYAQTGGSDLPTLFFVHGTPGSWEAFAGYLKDSALRNEFRMIAIDRPGFGYSDFGMAENLERQSDLISPVLRSLRNGQPFYLVGHSLGGPLVVKLAADNAGWVDGIVIVSGSVDPAEEKPESWRPWLFKTPLNLLVPGAFRPSNEELWYLKKDLVKLQKDFARVYCPVLFIHGLADTWVPPGNVAYASKLLVHAPWVGEDLLPGANHFIPWTRFKEIRGRLLALGGSGPVRDRFAGGTARGGIVK